MKISPDIMLIKDLEKSESISANTHHHHPMPSSQGHTLLRTVTPCKVRSAVGDTSGLLMEKKWGKDAIAQHRELKKREKERDPSAPQEVGTLPDV